MANLLEVIGDFNYNEIIRTLENGADPNNRNEHGVTSLMHASREDKIDIVRLLLEYGADPNIQSQNGNTALMIASDKNNIDIVRLLLENGAKTDFQNKYGNTALILASDKNNIIVRLLLEKGADPNIQSNDGDTALVFAVIKNRIDIARLLLENGADPNIQFQNDPTVLSIAAKQNNIDIVRLLLENGADPNIENKYGTSALSIAIDENNIDIVRLLLEKGAMAQHHTDIVRLLLEKGAKSKLRDSTKSTEASTSSSRFELNITDDKINSFDENFFKDSQFIKIRINAKRLENIPDNAFTNKLKHLSIISEKLKRLPESLYENGKNLESLELHAPIRDFKLLSFKTNVNNLCLSHIKNFQDQLHILNSFTKLEVLELSIMDDIHTFPRDFLRGSQLREFIINNLPRLQSLDDGFLNTNKNLRSVSITKVHVNHIPNISFSNSELLENITIDNTSITSIPNCIYNLPNLKTLYLRYNKIVDIDENVFDDLSKLESVDLEGNPLSFLSLGRLYKYKSIFKVNIFKKYEKWLNKVKQIKIIRRNPNNNYDKRRWFLSVCDTKSTKEKLLKRLQHENIDITSFENLSKRKICQKLEHSIDIFDDLKTKCTSNTSVFDMEELNDDIFFYKYSDDVYHCFSRKDVRNFLTRNIHQNPYNRMPFDEKTINDMKKFLKKKRYIQDELLE